MNDNNINNQDLQTSKKVDQKPLFETSNAKIFVNLHKAAMEKAAVKLGYNAKDKSINSFIINTGMSQDGSTIADANSFDDNGSATAKLFNGDKFELGVIMQVTEWKTVENDSKATDDKKEVEKYEKENEASLKKVKAKCLEGINEYFNWFAGIKGAYSENDLIEFVPDYNGGKIQLKGIEIVGMDDEAKDAYLANRQDKIKGKDGKEDKGGNFKPRVGFKVGYTIKYK